jgi:diguanylate cyclase (GGDEF)-like protein
MPASHSRIGAASAQEKPPRLVLRFAIFTALGLALAGAAIVLVVRQADMVQSQRHAISRARLAAEAVLKHELRPADLAAPVPSRRQRALDELSDARVLVEGIQDMTIYSADGGVTYSTQENLARRPLPGTYLNDALTGSVVSEIGPSAGRSARVLRTFVPVVIGPKRTTGIVALEQDYAPIEASALGSAWLIAGVLEVLLLILAVIFVPVLARVSYRIRRHVQDLEHIATHDELTELPNRLGFRHRVENVLSSREPQGTLLLIDVDGFTEINDVLGYGSGDSLLSQVADRLRRGLPDCEVVARLGEDEFGVLLGTPGLAEIAGVATRVDEVLAEPFLVDGIRIAVTVSIGAAILGEHGADFATVLRHAGVALSTAKAEGQDKIQIYDLADGAIDVSRVALTAELREALDRGQLVVYYQPLLDLGTRTVRGVEALLRWQHPERGLLTAGEFIEQAERSGLAHEIRRFVLGASARQWQEWSAFGVDLEFAVNLSTVDMLDASLPDEIADLLDRYQIPPWNLILEITERTLIGDERRTNQVIERLSGIGVRLAIDDLGTGQSSLASLRRFPIQQIKLDRSLLAGAPGDAPAEAIVSSCVEIAHAIGATVVAEGIETHDQWMFAHAVGCDKAQGYLIGRPAPGDALLELLQQAPVVSRAA